MVKRFFKLDNGDDVNVTVLEIIMDINLRTFKLMQDELAKKL